MKIWMNILTYMFCANCYWKQEEEGKTILKKIRELYAKEKGAIRA